MAKNKTKKKQFPKIKLPDTYRWAKGDECRPPKDYTDIPIGTIVKPYRVKNWKIEYEADDECFYILLIVVEISPTKEIHAMIIDEETVLDPFLWDSVNGDYDYWLDNNDYPCRIVALKREVYNCYKCRISFYDELHYLCEDCRIN